MRLVTLFVFIAISTINLVAQNSLPIPFFSDDLYNLSKQTSINLKPNTNDAVRGKVADFFNDSNKTFSVDNKSKTAMSASFWFLPKQLEVHSGTLLGEDGLFYFRYLSNRQIQFNHYKKDNINTTSLLSNDVWQHVGFTLSKEGNLIVYYNGEPVLKDHISSDWWKHKRTKLIVGNDPYDLKPEGSFDKLKIWDSVLSEADFKEDYKTSLRQTNLYHKLQIYLPLQGDFKDHSLTTKVLEKSVGVEFVQDAEKGLVANFKKDTSLLRFRDLKIENQISIATWLNPQKKKILMGICGNKDFAFRYKPIDNILWFTVPNVFKSVSHQPAINTENWVHLAVTINYNHKINFYINGALVDTQAIGGNIGKDTFLEIGNSFWGDVFKGKMSEFAIWSKVLSDDEIKAVYQGQLETDKLLFNKTNNSAFYVIGSMFLLILSLLTLWFIRKKRKENTTVVIKEVERKEFPKSNAIFLFDNFKAFDKNGMDVSQAFTPTLIRLFSLILLFPRVKQRNIGSTELSDFLWETDSISQQKNNRGTNVHRLRKILSSFEGISLNYENRKWVFDIEDGFFIDMVFFYNFSLHEIVNYSFKNLQLCKALRVSNFDNLILQIDDQNVEKIKTLCISAFEIKNWVQLREASHMWLSVDPLSEIALKYQISALQQLNKKQLSLDKYTFFASYYSDTLNEKFPLSFEECSFLVK